MMECSHAVAWVFFGSFASTTKAPAKIIARKNASFLASKMSNPENAAQRRRAAVELASWGFSEACSLKLGIFISVDRLRLRRFLEFSRWPWRPRRARGIQNCDAAETRSCHRRWCSFPERELY